MEEIKIYVANTESLRDASVFERLFSTLGEERRARIESKKREEDKRLSLGAELLLRFALEKEGIFSYSVKRDENGKPYLAGDKSLFFNLSHSKSRVMCVLSDRAVGCDVQWMDPSVSLSVADRFFLDEECALIRSQKTEAARRLMFYRIWSLRESFVKATGLGLWRTSKSFSVMPAEEGYLSHGIDRSMPSHFCEPCREAEYRYAVCGERERFAPVEWIFLEKL
ncbi:MAG: 4'-phosphopantetheinyl transferase superfamily protein [Ruminococcaceae bacterium]|nr:4'-phosphopantetheinyl transferase superfamily protein [Oscillospiraceae bacterium]